MAQSVSGPKDPINNDYHTEEDKAVPTAWQIETASLIIEQLADQQGKGELGPVAELVSKCLSRGFYTVSQSTVNETYAALKEIIIKEQKTGKARQKPSQAPICQQ